MDDTIKLCEVGTGLPLPLGVSAYENGVNFAFFSRHATRVRLELFDQPEDAKPSRFFDLLPERNRTGDVWHIWLEGIQSGQRYGIRIDGPYEPTKGHRFNFNKLLIDPFATAITEIKDWRFGPAIGYTNMEEDTQPSTEDNAGQMPKCIYISNYFDWGDQKMPRHSWSETIIYETHVRGLTIDPSSDVSHPGTYRGLIEKIPYFKDLGVTAIELMPIQEFNENAGAGVNPETGEVLKNYWGYDPVAFLAPKASYSSAGGLGQQKLEFQEMVKAFHEADIEIILDVVYNHTAEGNEHGPTLSFRGIDNRIFYMLVDEDQRYYKNYTGIGNTINANHPVVQELFITALRYWVVEMHVDGFRFDMAAALSRGRSGEVLPNSPLLERIAEDPILREVKVIAEAWDSAGAYEVGNFSERRWSEWNGKYRDQVRQFWRGDDGIQGAFVQRICGSSDLYGPSSKGPDGSINFITCHDGFTLYDLVSYESKHNEANGENNADGINDNCSENNGVEGDTEDGTILDARKRQIRNFLLTLMVSRGTPMLLGGDEFCRTQGGNNNAYCQDNPISWTNWDYLKKYEDIYAFTKGMIAFRKAHPVLSQQRFYEDGEVTWRGPEGGVPDWSDPRQKQFGFMVREDDQHAILVIFNAGIEALEFRMPVPPEGSHWYVAVDTHVEAEKDIFPVGQEPVVEDTGTYLLGPKSSAILIARPEASQNSHHAASK